MCNLYSTVTKDITKINIQTKLNHLNVKQSFYHIRCRSENKTESVI